MTDPERIGTSRRSPIDEANARSRPEEPPPGEAGPTSARKLVESFLEVLPSPVFVKDEQHRWALLNAAFCRFMGREREELLGKSDFDFFPPEEARVFWAKDDEVFAGGGLNENEEQFTDSSGRTHVIITRKSLHVDEQGRRFLLGVITDITALREATEQLRQSRDALEDRVQQRTAELRASNELLREQEANRTAFLAVLSHELRNPLAPISNSIYLLDRAAPGSEQESRAREVLRRQTEHLTRLVDDLLDVTRISKGKIDLRPSRLDLRDVIRKTTDDLRSLFESSEVELRVEHAVGPVWVDADATRMAQVIGNLLTNAVKFTPRNGRVVVRVAADERSAEVSVRDTGIGMERVEVERMFEPFAQADRGLARTKGGLGLGLALVKGLVELHGGSVRAQSEGPGRGAEFVVSLPLSSRQPAPASGGDQVVRAATGRFVLVIEDNADAGQSLADILELYGHEVHVARDGQSGLELARERRPDVILCDIGLPDLDGFEVARAIRRDEALRSVPLVALSGYAQPEDRQRAREAGFDAYVSKPPNIDEVVKVIARVT